MEWQEELGNRLLRAEAEGLLKPVKAATPSPAEKPAPAPAAESESEKPATDSRFNWVREGLNEGFKFNNPRERDRCGCGESFRV
jgi:hypothetical protein